MPRFDESSRRRPVFERDQNGEVDPTATPKLVLKDGTLNWELADREQRQQTQRATSAAPEANPAPLTATEQALVAANRAKIEQLKSQPQGVDELELGDLLRVVTRHSGADIGLSVAGLALQVGGIVPVAIWESVMAAAGIGLAVTHRHRDHARELVLASSDSAEELWQTHPEFVMGIVVNILHSIAQAAAIDDTELENRLDAYYPHWSRTDFEFDLRHYFH